MPQQSRKTLLKGVNSYASVAKGAIEPENSDMPLLVATKPTVGLAPVKEHLDKHFHSEQNEDVGPGFSTVLRDGARFSGYQTSLDCKYRVEITLEQVDLAESYLCGCLNIAGLTEDYENLTTFFEGEIIGPKYSFVTSKWDATEEKDFEHWNKFRGFGPFRQNFHEDGFKYDFNNHDVIFMRWKEIFLVPDYRMRAIDGASFAGFYYIAFSLSTKQIIGYYYHTKSELFQELRLNYDEDHGIATFEFC